MSMIIINRSETTITGSVNGKQFGVTFDEQKYQQMIALKLRADKAESMDALKSIVEEFEPLTKESYKEIVETKTPYIVVNKHTGKFFLKYQNTVSSQPLPQVFVDRILKSVEKNIDIEPLVKCWARYMRPIPGRPAYNLKDAKLFAEYIAAPYVNSQLLGELTKEGLSTEVATERSTTSQVSITQEGLLVCYKVSTEILHRYELNEDEEVVQKSRFKKSVDPDTGMVTYAEPESNEDRVFEPRIMGQGGDAFFCGDKLGHLIRVGNTHYLPEWNQVGMPGNKGLHVGGLRYIQGYQSDGTVTHNIFVDPSDIYGIAGLGIGNDGAMTVRRYFVFNTFNGVNKSIYHSSKYAAITDAEYAEIVKEAVKATEAKKEELAGLLGEAEALSIITADSAGGVEPTTAAKLFVDDDVKKAD